LLNSLPGLAPGFFYSAIALGAAAVVNIEFKRIGKLATAALTRRAGLHEFLYIARGVSLNSLQQRVNIDFTLRRFIPFLLCCHDRFLYLITPTL
jgi:hypothetical protein